MASSHIQPTLSVQNVPESVTFYCEVLGFDFQGYWDPQTNEAVQEWTRDEQPPYAEVTRGEARIGFIPADGSTAADGLQLSLHIEDLEAFHQRLVDRGANPTEPFKQPWGPTTFDVRDPSGFLWKFLGPVEESS